MIMTTTSNGNGLNKSNWYIRIKIKLPTKSVTSRTLFFWTEVDWTILNKTEQNWSDQNWNKLNFFFLWSRSFWWQWRSQTQIEVGSWVQYIIIFLSKLYLIGKNLYWNCRRKWGLKTPPKLIYLRHCLMRSSFRHSEINCLWYNTWIRLHTS